MFKYTPVEDPAVYENVFKPFPITYQKDWAIVRKVAEGRGERFNSAVFENLKQKETEAAAAKTKTQ